MGAGHCTGLLWYASQLAERRTTAVDGSYYGEGGAMGKDFDGVVNVDIRDSTTGSRVSRISHDQPEGG
jgi:hypothetical protein